MKRRQFIKRSASLAGSLLAASQVKVLAEAQAANAASSGGAVVIDPKPLFDISPHLYMQFMEPLGVTDPSVEAAWDYERDDWRKDFVETKEVLMQRSKELAEKGKEGLYEEYVKPYRHV